MDDVTVDRDDINSKTAVEPKNEEFVNFNDDSWEEEGQLLFEWTQSLSLENVVSTSRDS